MYKSMVNFYHFMVNDHRAHLALLAFTVGLLGCFAFVRSFQRMREASAGLRPWWNLALAILLGATLYSSHSIFISAARPEVASPEWAIVASVLLVLVAVGAVLADDFQRRRSSRESLRLHQLADGAMDGMVLCRNGQVLEANRAFCSMMGMTAQELRQRPLWQLAGLSSHASLDAVMDHTAPGPVEMEFCTASGANFAVEVTGHAIQYAGRPATLLAVRDLSERKQMQKRMEHLLHHDVHTNLANRTYFQDRLQQAIADARQSDAMVALFSIDLDRFKSVNDLLGQAAGDDLLVEVAARLQEVTRHTDTVARMGGDEFAIVLPRVQSAQNAALLAARIIHILQKPHMIGGGPVTITASIGIALCPQDGATAEALYQNADTALFRAKQQRGNSYCFFESRMDRQAQDHHVLEIELQGALQKKQLHLHYQPLFSTGDLHLTAFEALLRWQHPLRGNISPVDFVPLAEGTGLILPIGRWVLQTACQEAALWSRPYRISVNVSAMQLQHSNLVETVADVLRSTGLPADRLELEVTESIFLGDLDTVLRSLHEFKSMGVRITLDDFGTGYSSLSYLRRFPFDHIKIDRSFVTEMGKDAHADSIVRSIVDLGHSLDLCVTAEGVETGEQLAALKTNHCDSVQGFLLGRPVPSTALTPLRAAADNNSGASQEAVCKGPFQPLPVISGD